MFYQFVKMKFLGATLLCSIIAINLREGTSSSRDISAYLKEKGQYKAFCNVNFITPRISLTVPECLVRKNKILNHEEIQVILFDSDGWISGDFNVSSILGERQTLIVSRFAIITLEKVPCRYENFVYTYLPVPSDFDNLHDQKTKMIYGLDKNYDCIELYSPVKFLAPLKNDMAFFAYSVHYNKGNWLGGGIFNGDKLIAVCYHQEFIQVYNDNGHKVSCRSIYNIFKQKLFYYLPLEVQEKLSPMWHPEIMEAHEASGSKVDS